MSRGAPQINQMLWALRAPMHGLMKEGPGSSPPLMVDIGANIGWFTLNAAAAGARVAAFEGGSWARHTAAPAPCSAA